MENYTIKKEVFAHESGAFKSFIAINKKTQKDYLLTTYDLNYYKDKKIQICRKIISICQTIKFYRCCQVFFNHEIFTLESIRPSNIGTFLRKFTVVEPFPMVSLGDYFDSGKINIDAVMNGFSDIFRTLATLHYLNIGYGCLSPLNVIVTNGMFSLRPPNLSKYQCSCTPPPLISRNRYRFKTEIVHYPHDRNLKNSKRVDCLCYGYLLCDYLLYFGRNISFILQKKYRQLNLYFKKFSLPQFIMNFLKPDHDVFLDESIRRNLKQFIFNRRRLLVNYTNHRFVDPSKFNEKPIPTKRKQKGKAKSLLRKTKSNRLPNQYSTNNHNFQNIYVDENYDQNINENYDFNIYDKHYNSEADELYQQTIKNKYSNDDNDEYMVTKDNYNNNSISVENLEPQFSNNHNFKDLQNINNQNYGNGIHATKPNLKIDNVDCYTIENARDFDYQACKKHNDDDNFDSYSFSQNASDIERYSAYSDAANSCDQDDSFNDNNEFNGNIEEYNLIYSSDSDSDDCENNKSSNPNQNPRKPNRNICNFCNQNLFDLQSFPCDCQEFATKNYIFEVTSDSEDNFALPSFNNLKYCHNFIVKFKLEYDKEKYPNHKFSIQIYAGTPPRSKMQSLLSINKKVQDIKHHHVNKEIHLNEKILKLCQKEGITVCVMFNNAVYKDLLHLNLRNISFIPFYDNNLNRIFSVQTTFEETN